MNDPISNNLMRKLEVNKKSVKKSVKKEGHKVKERRKGDGVSIGEKKGIEH